MDTTPIVRDRKQGVSKIFSLALRRTASVTMGPRLKPGAWAAFGSIAALLATGLISGCSGNGKQAAVHGQSSFLATEVVDEFLPATGAQNAAGLKFANTETFLKNSIVARCMTGHGFGPQYVPYINWDEKYYDQLSPSVAGFAGMDVSAVDIYDIEVLSHGGLLGEVPLGVPAPPKLAAAEANAVDADYRRCLVRAAQVFKKLTHDGTALGYLWLQQVNVIHASARVQAEIRGFTSCAVAHGVPTSAAGSLDAFDGWLSQLVNIPPSRATTSIAFRVAEDRHWTKVFVICGRGTVALEDKLQLAAQHAFLQAHYQELTALETLANRAVSSARELVGKKTL